MPQVLHHRLEGLGQRHPRRHDICRHRGFDPSTLSTTGEQPASNGEGDEGYPIPGSAADTSSTTDSFAAPNPLGWAATLYSADTSSQLAALCSAQSGSSSPTLTGTIWVGTPNTVTFNYNGTNGTDGAPEIWTAPAGVTSVLVTALGAQGGCDSIGGQGGEASGTLGVSPGQLLLVYVGGDPGSTYGIGGFNGGGGTTDPNVAGCGGGGASDVRLPPTDSLAVSSSAVEAAAGGILAAQAPFLSVGGQAAIQLVTLGAVPLTTPLHQPDPAPRVLGVSAERGAGEPEPLV